MTKPRLLYFSPGQRYKELVVPNNHEPMIDRMDRWMEYHFEVITISQDCDLGEMVRKHNPDMILFDGLLEGTSKLRLTITSLDAYPEIPRGGFSRVDALSPTRGNSFEELKRKGAEVFFVLAEPIMGEAMPDFADDIIHIPWFFDPNIFKDYKEQKIIPVGMFGTFECPPYMYPWRAAVKHALLDNFPALYFRHPGYDLKNQKDNPLVLFGEAYARTLSSCLIAPTQGGFTDIVVSKHFEIPASGALLVTQEGASVLAHGFRHGDNCMFADPDDIVEQMRSLLSNRERLDAIAKRGHDFVHSNHTFAQRPQMVQWLELRKKLKPGQKIIQPTLLGDLTIVPATSPEKTFHIYGNPMQKLLKASDEAFLSGDFMTLERYCKKLISFCGYLSEPMIRLCLARLISGDPNGALTHIEPPIVNRFSMGALQCDPIEWGIFLLTLAAANEKEKLLDYATQFEEIHSRELNVCRWIAGVILGHKTLIDFSLEGLKNNPKPHFSIHRFPNYLLPDIIVSMEQILGLCGLHTEKNALANAPTRSLISPYARVTTQQ
jgi:hypothetical protein